jgi:DNA-binding MarR family transcriptional regulator
MFKQVLKEIARGHAHSHADLARRLEISESMLDQMIQELTHRGYLTAISQVSTCHSCSGCQLSDVCSSERSEESGLPKRWSLTAKGRHRIRK